jgi:hypothetical protein
MGGGVKNKTKRQQQKNRTKRKEKKMTNCETQGRRKTIDPYIFGCSFKPSHLRFSGSIQRTEK